MISVDSVCYHSFLIHDVLQTLVPIAPATSTKPDLTRCFRLGKPSNLLCSFFLLPVFVFFLEVRERLTMILGLFKLQGWSQKAFPGKYMKYLTKCFPILQVLYFVGCILPTTKTFALHIHSHFMFWVPIEDALQEIQLLSHTSFCMPVENGPSSFPLRFL